MLKKNRQWFDIHRLEILIVVADEKTTPLEKELMRVCRTPLRLINLPVANASLSLRMNIAVYYSMASQVFILNSSDILISDTIHTAVSLLAECDLYITPRKIVQARVERHQLNLTQTRNHSELDIYNGAEQLALAATELFVSTSVAAIEAQGCVRVALSGGSTPHRVYELLATEAYSRRVDWKCVELFWGDERYVPLDDRESNYRMTTEALLRHVPIPATNIHRVRTEISPSTEAASAYEIELRRSFQSHSEIPQFDLIVLGIGTNGHTASLFPYSPVLHEQYRLIAADFVSEVNMWRITMTLPLLNRGRTVAFLAEGSQKAEVLRDVLRGPRDPQRLPAQLISPEGRLRWMLDEAAASLLPESDRKRSA